MSGSVVRMSLPACYLQRGTKKRTHLGRSAIAFSCLRERNLISTFCGPPLSTDAMFTMSILSSSYRVESVTKNAFDSFVLHLLDKPMSKRSGYPLLWFCQPAQSA